MSEFEVVTFATPRADKRNSEEMCETVGHEPEKSAEGEVERKYGGIFNVPLNVIGAVKVMRVNGAAIEVKLRTRRKNKPQTRNSTQPSAGNCSIGTSKNSKFTMRQVFSFQNTPLSLAPYECSFSTGARQTVDNMGLRYHCPDVIL